MVELISLIGNGLTVLLILFGIFYIYAKYNLSYWKRRGVPSIPADLIFGNVKDVVFLRNSINNVLAQLHESAKDSPYIGFYVLHRPCLLLKSPEILKHVLVKDFETFADRQFAGRSKRDVPGTQNLFSMNMPEWKYVRSKISPALTSGKLKKMVPLMIETAETMLEYVNQQPTNSKFLRPIKLKDTSSKYTTDIISSLAFGVRTNSFGTPEPEFRAHGRKIFDISLWRVFGLFLTFFFPEFRDTLRFTMLGKSEKFFKNAFWNSINAREKSGGQRGDLIDSLINLKNEKQSKEYQFTGDHLFAHSAIFFLAGHETSSLTMSLALMELAKQPELQDKARREIKDQFEKYGVTQEAFENMKYVHQVIDETLRMYPPAPIIDRVALKDYQVPDSDLVIKKGTSVYVTLFGLHGDPRYFPEPDKFDPDRFSEERKHSIPSMTYMPFGEGPRYCIGKRIGLMQTVVGMSMILSKYEISPNPDIETVLDPKAIFLKPLNDVNVYLKKIDPSISRDIIFKCSLLLLYDIRSKNTIV